jgi:Fic family protein
MKKKATLIAIGYQALLEQFKLSVMPHYRQSYIISQGRGYVDLKNSPEIHVFPKTYALSEPDNPFQQLDFALKYDGINLEILHAVFKHLDSNLVKNTIQTHPTSKYARTLWFIYEFLSGITLDLPPIKKVKYFDLLDPKKYFTLLGTKISRQCINNNLLGTVDFCPILRKTPLLRKHIDCQYDAKVRTLAAQYDARILTRASYYLYKKETISSYKIERETPGQERLDRFIYLLKQAFNITTLTKSELVELQNIIVEPRFQESHYRVIQNYIGESISPYMQKIHYIPPKPENIEPLMQGLLKTLENTLSGGLHPVLIAAIISFGFVFIHPFEDGNGRLHRFLIHYILAKTEFTPPNIIFPISAVILKNISMYDRVLESFSKPLMQLITQYQLSQEGFLAVQQETASYYPFLDYTHLVEYLFDCIQETLHEHFEEELKFLVNYDKTKTQIQLEIDMPDRLIDLFIQCVLQNNGTLSSQKRKKYFQKLKNNEITFLESIVRNHLL